MTDVTVTLSPEEISFLMGGIHTQLTLIELGNLPLDKCPIDPQEMWLLTKKLQGMPAPLAAQFKAGIVAQRATNAAFQIIKDQTND